MNLTDLNSIETTPGVVNKVAKTILSGVGFGVLLSVKKDTKDTKKIAERIDTNVSSIKNTVNSISVDTTTIKKQTAANAALLKDFLAEEEDPIEEPVPAYPPYPQQYPQRWGYPPQAPAWPGYQGMPQMPSIPPQAPAPTQQPTQQSVQQKSSADDFMSVMKLLAGAIDRGLAAEQTQQPVQQEAPAQQPAPQPAQQVNVNVTPVAPVQEPAQQQPQQEAPQQPQPDNTGKGKK